MCVGLRECTASVVDCLVVVYVCVLIMCVCVCVCLRVRVPATGEGCILTYNAVRY